MKINSNYNINKFPGKNDSENKRVDTSKKEKVAPGAIYEKSKPEEKLHVYDRVSIEKLKKESENVYGQLKEMVEKMLTDQGKTFKLLKVGDMVRVDEGTRLKAKELIGEDGPLGVEAMSDKIVDFAKGVSGGDKEKLNSLIKAIDKGFREAERILGQLPEVSQKTYDRIMEKLDAWKEEK